MNKIYKNIIMCIAALLMMLPMVMGASADVETAQIMPVLVGAEPTMEDPMIPHSPDAATQGGGKSTEGTSPYDPNTPISECIDNGMDGNWVSDCNGPDIPRDDLNENDIVITLPVDPVIEPPQEYPGNDVGPCVIGTPSPCNDPRYWWPERWDWSWDWNRWIHHIPPPVTIPEPPDFAEPPIVTLPVEDYLITDPPEYYVLPVESEETGMHETHWIPAVGSNQNSLSCDEIQNLPGVSGTGITGSVITGIGEDDEQIAVYLEEYNLETISKLPREVDGKRIVYTVSGPAIALPVGEPAEPASKPDVQAQIDPIEPEHKEGTVSDSRKGEAAPAVAGIAHASAN